MKRVRCEIPFHMNATDKDYVPGDTLEVDDNTISRMYAVNANLVTVLGEVEETPEEVENTPQKRRSKKPKE